MHKAKHIIQKRFLFSRMQSIMAHSPIILYHIVVPYHGIGISENSRAAGTFRVLFCTIII